VVRMQLVMRMRITAIVLMCAARFRERQWGDEENVEVRSLEELYTED
jgi:hypothetical protein